MTDLEMVMQRTILEDFERLQKKVFKVLTPILAQKKAEETSLWAKGEISKEADRTLKEAHKALDDWHDNR